MEHWINPIEERHDFTFSRLVKNKGENKDDKSIFSPEITAVGNILNAESFNQISKNRIKTFTVLLTTVVQ